MHHTTKPLHVLFVLDHFYPYIGGGETLSYELTRGLVRNGHKVTVVTSKFQYNLKRHDHIDGVDIVRVGTNRINFQWLGFWHAWDIIRSSQKTDMPVRIIHGSTFFSIIPTFLLGLVTKAKTVLTVHEIYGKLRFQFLGMLGCINYLYERICMNICRFDQYICVSNYTKNCLRLMYGIPDAKLRTIYNGIDYDFWDKDKVDQQSIQTIKHTHNLENAYVGLYFGRMGVAKGMNDVLRALPEIVKQIPHYKQVFITPKQQAKTILGLKSSFSLQEIQQFIDDNNLGSHIVRLESVPRTTLRDWIALSDVVILPSRAEGFGFAVAEVCALGSKLVTTNVASIPEVVHGAVGFVEPGNAQDIAQKVVNMYHKNYEIIGQRRFTRLRCITDTTKTYTGLFE